jgi:hypothetical protein
LGRYGRGDRVYGMVDVEVGMRQKGHGPGWDKEGGRKRMGLDVDGTGAGVFDGSWQQDAAC